MPGLVVASTLRTRHEFDDPERAILVLSVLGDDCRWAGWPRAATAFLREALGEGRALGSPDMTADAQLGLAQVTAMQSPAASAAWLDRAQRSIRDVPDPVLRSRLEGEAIRVVAETPGLLQSRSLETLGTSLEWLRGRNSDGLMIPLLVRRAQLRSQAGEVELGAQDLDHALALGAGAAVSGELTLRRAASEHVAQAYAALIDIRAAGGATPAETLGLAETMWTTLAGVEDPLMSAHLASNAARSAATGTCVLGLLSSGGTLHSWVLCDAGVSYLRSVVPEASLLSDLAALRTDLRAGKTGSGPARRLYRYLLGPHAKRLEGADRLLIATSGPLSNVPFAALTMPDGGLVAGRLEIALVPSVASALRTPREYGELADLSMLSVGFAGGPPDLPRLRNAEGEATSVAARFAHAEVLLGGAATPEAIEARLSRVGILHVSAHALANLEDPGRSSVVLAGPVEGASHWMARRIRERPLDHIALVTLAGCETSRGDPTPAGHGWSLAQAFLAAGAGSVVGTLWPLSDEGSPLVMEHYYSELLRTGRPAFAVARTLTHFRDSPVAADAASLVVFSAAMGAAGSV